MVIKALLLPFAVLVLTTQDAVPKKRGPKTDVLEALLKRVDGLERRLQEEKSPDADITTTATSSSKQEVSADVVVDRRNTITSFQRSVSSVNNNNNGGEDISPLSFHDRRGSLGFLPTYNNNNNNNNTSNNGFDNTSNGFRQQQQNSVLPDAILDTFFSRIHGKPFYILEESNTRQKHQLGQLPSHLVMAIYALTVR